MDTRLDCNIIACNKQYNLQIKEYSFTNVFIHPERYEKTEKIKEISCNFR